MEQPARAPPLETQMTTLPQTSLGQERTYQQQQQLQQQPHSEQTQSQQPPLHQKQLSPHPPHDRDAISGGDSPNLTKQHSERHNRGHGGHGGHSPRSKGRLAKELEETKKKERNSHRWADKLFCLPEAFVIPKELRLKIAEEDEESGHGNGADRRALALRHARVDFIRRLGAELVGTLVLAGAHATLRMKAHEQTLLEDGNAIFAGLTLVLLIYALGEISGAHFNPCVTLAFSIRRMFPPMWLPAYWVMQLCGALLGGSIIRGFFGQDRAYHGTNYVSPDSGFTDVSAMMYEAMLTSFLLLTILSVATRGGIVGLHAALAVGAVIALDVALGAGITGGSMNPFRTIGPGVVNGPQDSLWIFVAGPFIGTFIALIVVWLLSGSSSVGARKAAMGSGGM